jgi:hypothetical protein
VSNLTARDMEDLFQVSQGDHCEPPIAASNVTCWRQCQWLHLSQNEPVFFRQPRIVDGCELQPAAGE